MIKFLNKLLNIFLEKFLQKFLYDIMGQPLQYEFPWRIPRGFREDSPKASWENFRIKSGKYACKHCRSNSRTKKNLWEFLEEPQKFMKDKHSCKKSLPNSWINFCESSRGYSSSTVKDKPRKNFWRNPRRFPGGDSGRISGENIEENLGRTPGGSPEGNPGVISRWTTERIPEKTQKKSLDELKKMTLKEF